MIISHKQRHSKKDDRDYPGPDDRAGVRRLLEYFQRESAHGQTVHNDFVNEDIPTMLDQMELMREGAKVRCWGRHIVVRGHERDRDKLAGKSGELVEGLKKKFGCTHAYAVDHHDKLGRNGQPITDTHVWLWELGANRSGLPFSERAVNSKTGKEYTKSIAGMMRDLAENWEGKYDLVRTGRNKGQDRAVTYTKNQLEMAAREHREGKRATPAPDKMMLQVKLDRLVRTAGSIDELATLCIAEGLEMRISDFVNKDGRPGKGISFCVAGRRPFRGGELGWSWPKLQKFYERTESGSPEKGAGIIGLGGTTDPVYRGQTGAGDPAGAAESGRSDGGQPDHAQRSPAASRQGRAQNPLIGLLATPALSWFMRAFIRLCMSVDRSARQQYYDELRKDRALDLPTL